jgi:predicted enzyme related to lactoylglutathione lyase
VTGSIEVTMDSVDPERAAAFWSEALGYERLYERGRYVMLAPPPGDGRPRLVIQDVDEVTPGKTPVHLDLRVDDPDAEVQRLAALGATVKWVIDETELGLSRWTTMADPQGTLFCVCPSRPEET